PRMAQVAALWTRASRGRVGQPWTDELLRRRYGAIGTSYSLVLVNEGRRLVAAAVYRAVRRERLLLGVLMDVVAEDDGEERAGFGAALAAVERQAYGSGCHVVLALDGPGVLPTGALGKAGYLRSPENYVFLIWPCRELGPESPLLDLQRWRYGFGDHDAF
ncbi:MAG TPA: hypothetical protein VF894_07090, partial [Anaeromyxobacter sp.]